MVAKGPSRRRLQRGEADVEQPALLSLRRPDVAVLDSLVRSQRGMCFSYSDVGATPMDLPHGYRHVGKVVRLGSDGSTFRRAVEALYRWRTHVEADVDVYPRHREVEAGDTFVLVARLGPLYGVVACRVVYVVDETDRFGFAYGTLPHHLIEGEEAFFVERDVAGDVRFRISGFFRPRRGALRLLAPVLAAGDRRLVGRYLRAMRERVARVAG